MVDVAAGLGIDQGYAGLLVEMAGEIGELVGEHFEDRRIDLDAADLLGAEQQRGQNVPAAADADDGNVGRRLHQIGAVDDVVLQIAELAEVAIEAGDDGRGIGVDVEIVLIDLGRRRARKAPAERHGFAHRGDADARIGVPALEQRAGLLRALGPEHAEMALAGNIERRHAPSRPRRATAPPRR